MSTYTVLLLSDGRVTDTHMYKRAEEHVAIVCSEHGISRFLFSVEFILNSDNTVNRKMPIPLK